MRKFSPENLPAEGLQLSACRLEARITKLEVDENTSKNRIESPESWIQKHDEKIQEVSDKAKEDHENIEMLKEKLVSLEGTPKHDTDCET